MMDISSQTHQDFWPNHNKLVYVHVDYKESNTYICAGQGIPNILWTN